MVSAKTHRFWGNAFFQSELIADEQEVVFERPATLKTVRECIPYDKIAAVHLSVGMFTSTVSVETTGSKVHSITALPHGEAEVVVKAIRGRIVTKV